MPTVRNSQLNLLALCVLAGACSRTPPAAMSEKAGETPAAAVATAPAPAAPATAVINMEVPYANCFWPVIAVDPVFARVLANPKSRFLLNGETNPKPNADGLMTLYFAAEKPGNAPDGNWLPTTKDNRLTFRFHGPKGVADGSYYLPPLEKKS